MSDVPKIPPGILTPEQIEKVSGGDCSLADLGTIVPQLKSAYEGLIDFTVYVMERVAGK
jgi:hypothetical protein